MFRELRNNLLVLLLCSYGLSVRAQGSQDSLLPYNSYRDHLVVYTDIGYATAPMKLKYPYTSEIKRLRFRNNLSAVLGFGVSYKWFALRLGVTLPGTLRSRERFGKTTYYDLGFDFTVKRMFWDVDFHLYQGYAIRNAYRWNDSLDNEHPNEIRPDINSASLSVNAWFFQSKAFKMSAMRGKTGSYVKDVRTMYFKYSLSYHGISADRPLIPTQLEDTNQSKTRSSTIAALDFAVLPGFAYVKRWRQFQIGAMIGAGLATQSKFYTFDDQTRSFLGLAFRYDIKFIAGYNQPRYFLMLVTDFDNKSIRFNDLVYRQTFYYLKLVGGIRFPVKKKKELPK